MILPQALGSPSPAQHPPPLPRGDGCPFAVQVRLKADCAIVTQVSLSMPLVPVLPAVLGGAHSHHLMAFGKLTRESWCHPDILPEILVLFPTRPLSLFQLFQLSGPVELDGP